MRAALLTACALGSLPAQEMRLVLPAGATRDQEVAVRCYGKGLKDTNGVVWFRDGIEVLAIEAERDDRIELRLKVPADCELGTYLFALQTHRGLTRAQAFRVGPLPSIAELKAHATREQAQPIALDTTVDGRILPEEVDWFSFEATTGQIVRVEAEGVRLGMFDLDLQFEIFAPDGSMLVRSDDTALGKADPMAAFAAQTDGTYTLALRDVAYRGSIYGAYRLHVGTFPRPVGLLPAGGRPGEVVEVTLLGDAEPATASLTMPGSAGVHEVFPIVDGRRVPTPVLVAVDDRQGFVEGQVPAEPQVAPCAFHGVIATPNECDRFAFTAKKGARVEIRVLARTLRSPLDPVLSVRDQDGKSLADNDDGLGLDGRLRFNPPADGTYEVAVVDHLGRGGPAYFYRVEIGASTGDATTSEAVPGRRAEDLGVAVPRGGHNATVISVNGIDARDGITLDFEALPSGVRALAARVPEGTTTVPIVFMATGEAELAAGLATPTAHTDKGDRRRVIRHEHDFPLLRVRNNQAYDNHTVRALPVVVTDAMPFAIAAAAPKVPIVRNGSMTLPVEITRRDGFTGTVTVRALWLPPGLAAGAVRLTKQDCAGGMAFNANSTAAIGIWPIVLVASTDVDGVARTISTEALPFDLQEPWITAKLPRVRMEQGAGASFEVELERRHAFEHKVTAELGRVPTGVSAEVPPITADAVKLPIALQAEAGARVGRHRSIYLRLDIETPDGVISHAIGGGEIRVDEPLPPALDPPAETTTGRR